MFAFCGGRDGMERGNRATYPSRRGYWWGNWHAALCRHRLDGCAADDCIFCHGQFRERVEKASQVLANAGLAGLLAIAAWRFPSTTDASRILIACCFSSAAADTLSSELGSVYGKKFFNILSFKKDRNGLDGVVSAEGFLFGLAGSLVIALIFLLFKGRSDALPWILVAGTAGNLADSLFGAAWERKGRIGNDTVNFLNTLTAVTVGYLLYLS